MYAGLSEIPAAALKTSAGARLLASSGIAGLCDLPMKLRDAPDCRDMSKWQKIPLSAGAATHRIFEHDQLCNISPPQSGGTKVGGTANTADNLHIFSRHSV
jgi:hypothetical protein